MEHNGSPVFAFLSLKQEASTCHHPDDVEKEKALCTERVDLKLSHLAIVCVDLDALIEKLKGAA